jgi:alkylhydroperoxidase/carboxymuconolactone decarboxylase family protein YurZ
LKAPVHYQRLGDEFPGLLAAYESLNAQAAAAGPLSERERALVKLALSLGAGLEGGLASHGRKALEAGLSAQDLQHACLLALPTLGLPRTMMGWKKILGVIEEAAGG